MLHVVPAKGAGWDQKMKKAGTIPGLVKKKKLLDLPQNVPISAKRAYLPCVYDETGVFSRGRGWEWVGEGAGNGVGRPNCESSRKSRPAHYTAGCI